MLVMRLRLAQLRLGHQLSILAFAPGDLPSADSIRQLPSQPAVKRAGHQFQLIEDAARLDQALKAGKYDLVMADVSVADELRRRVESVPLSCQWRIKPQRLRTRRRRRSFIVC